MLLAAVFPTLFDGIKNKDALSFTDLFIVAANVVRILMYVAGVAAVIMMIVAGIMYITSAGNPESLARAKRTITNAVIGLVLVSLAYSIVTFLVGRLK